MQSAGLGLTVKLVWEERSVLEFHCIWQFDFCLFSWKIDGNQSVLDLRGFGVVQYGLLYGSTKQEGQHVHVHT